MVHLQWMGDVRSTKKIFQANLTAKTTVFYGRRFHVLIWAVVTTGSVNLQARSSVYCCLLFCSGQSVADCGTCRLSWRLFGVVLCYAYLSVPGTEENEHLETDGTCGRMLL